MIKEEFTDIFDDILLDVTDSGMKEFEDYKDKMEDFSFDAIFGGDNG